MTFALAVVPIALLLLGFPIFMVLLTAVTVALVFFMHVPLAVLHQNLFASVNATPLLDPRRDSAIRARGAALARNDHG